MNVYIVDDEKPIRQWFELILPKMDDVKIIGSFHNGKQVLDACENIVPDLIFTDIVMPVMDGIELIKKVKEKYPRVEFLIMSNYNDFDYVYRGLKLGARDYLLKAQTGEKDIKLFMDNFKEVMRKEKRNGLVNGEDNTAFDSRHYVVEQIIKYINENYSDQIRLEDLANRYNYNPDYLSQLLKEKTGKNFCTYMTDIRIAKAKKMLLNPKYRIKEIASDVGYSNEMYFSTAFKKKTGISPLQYSKTHQQTGNL